MSDPDREDRLSRWSRRKLLESRAVQTPPAPPEATPEATPPDAAPEAAADLTEGELLEKLGLPDPDTLMPGDDFSAFMRAQVPEFLRRRALRVLWRSNPVLANLDGLLDHGEDYTDAATVMTGMTTSYRVGSGMLRDAVRLVEDLGAEPAAAPEPEPETESALAPDATPMDRPDSAPVPEPTPEPAQTPAPPNLAGLTGTDAPPSPPRPRRMRFERQG